MKYEQRVKGFGIHFNKGRKPLNDKQKMNQPCLLWKRCQQKVNVENKTKYVFNQLTVTRRVKSHWKTAAIFVWLVDKQKALAGGGKQENIPELKILEVTLWRFTYLDFGCVCCNKRLKICFDFI